MISGLKMEVSEKLEISLPLPPSKNATKEPKTWYDRGRGRVVNHMVTSDSVYAYRTFVHREVKRHLELKPTLLYDKKKTVVECVWHIPNHRWDVVNYHDQLCDALAPALGLNDRFFLVRDMDYIIDHVWQGVKLTVYQL